MIMSSGTGSGSNRRKPSDASKRLKSTDRISELPETLIVHILSFLPIVYKIRTGALARKWKYLWTRAPKLYLGYNDCEDDDDDGPFEPDDSDSFVDYANKTLILCGGTTMKEFGVVFDYHRRHKSHVDGWTQFAARNGTEKFELCLCPEGHSYALPQHLYTLPSFRELKFRNCDVGPRGAVSSKHLKKLSIIDGKIADDALQKILGGSPVLEILEVQSICFRLTGPVSCKSLKKLSISDGSATVDGDALQKIIAGSPGLEILDLKYISFLMSGPVFCKSLKKLSISQGSFAVDSDAMNLSLKILAGSPVLEILDLQSVSFVLSGPVSYKSLKKLSISDGSITSDTLQKIVAGSPVLEILDVQSKDGGIYNLHLEDSSLKKLILHLGGWGPGCQRLGVAELEISAPNLQSLKVSGFFQSFKLVNMPSLVEANLYDLRKFEVTQCPIVTQEDLCSLSNAQTLTLGDWVIKGIEMLREKGVHPSLSKCKHLTIAADISNIAPKAIASLLKSSPGVETLIITKEVVVTFFRPEISHIKDEDWTSQEAASGYLTHLRTVKFVGFWDYSEDAFSFVRFLLKNAKNLQKMIINLEREDDARSFVSEEVFETFQKLLSFPRSSPDAELLVYK